jgi:hypothetical protein
MPAFECGTMKRYSTTIRQDWHFLTPIGLVDCSVAVKSGQKKIHEAMLWVSCRSRKRLGRAGAPGGTDARVLRGDVSGPAPAGGPCGSVSNGYLLVGKWERERAMGN